MESKFAKEKVVIVDTLGEAEEVGGLKVVVAMVVPKPVLVSNTAKVVAGGVTVVDESVVLVEVAATEVGGTVVVLVEGTVVVVEVEELVVVVEVEETVVVVGAALVVGTMVVTEELVEATILVRRFFNKIISSSPEIFCAKKMAQMTEIMLKFMMAELQIYV